LPPLISHFSELAGGYNLVFCDIWGVVHNGLQAFPAACGALMRTRAQGASVVFITNAPRPCVQVERQLARLHVPRETYDAIVSSGDVTHHEMRKRPHQSVFHLGPERDKSVFDGLNVNFAPLQDADYVVCTGLFDDTRETADDYRATLETMLARKLFMLCGNPDVVVERGTDLVYCAGAIADLYHEMGGEVLYAGKPFRPIYEMAVERAQAASGREIAPERVLAIGDSVRTDLAGAHAFGADCLFIAGGIHAEELGGRENTDIDALAKIFTTAGKMPKAVMHHLVW
jgi:HAD superfamily hydrolase (TIGR01459 family)